MLSLPGTRGGTRRLVLISGLFPIGLLAVAIAAASVFSGESVANRLRRASLRGDWPSVIALTERPGGGLDASWATRQRARALAGLGRGPEAMTLLATLEATRLDAEDFSMIARALIESGRLAPAWVALEAASRLDLQHRETIAARADLHARLETAGDTARRLDRLSDIPSAHALAELALGAFAISERTPAIASLDDLLDRDRAAFLRLDSPRESCKLIARVLLEKGAPAEALAWLDRPLAGGSDPEVAWLRSRAYLVVGDAEESGTQAELAGHFGSDTPMAVEPGRYAGARRCAECHANIYRSQQSSRHARTIWKGDAIASVPVPGKPLPDPEKPEVVHRIERRKGRTEANVQMDGASFRGIVDYVIGSGGHGMTMLAREASGRHRSLRMSYYTGGPAWDLTNSLGAVPSELPEFLGDSLSDENFGACLNCHSTRFRSGPLDVGPESDDRGIGCERCHGPGENHIKAVESGFPSLAVARPKLATPARRLSLCAGCHRADGDIPPSNPRFVRFHSTTLAYSRCLNESRGKLDCVTCHDPHGDASTDAAGYESRCLACHGGGNPPGSARADRVNASPCPINAKAGCLGCHMPKVENTVPFTKLTDHHIRIHKESHPGGVARAKVP